MLTAGYQRRGRRTQRALRGPVLINTTEGRGEGHLSAVFTLTLVPPSRSSLPQSLCPLLPAVFVNSNAGKRVDNFVNHDCRRFSNAGCSLNSLVDSQYVSFFLLQGQLLSQRNLKSVNASKKSLFYRFEKWYVPSCCPLFVQTYCRFCLSNLNISGHKLSGENCQHHEHNQAQTTLGWRNCYRKGFFVFVFSKK